MQKRSLVVAIALVGAFSAGWGVAQGKSTPSLTGQDYSEIQQLIARYNQGLDLEDLDMYAAIFTEDAVWRGSNARRLWAGRRWSNPSNSVSQRDPESTSDVIGKTTRSSHRRPMVPQHERTSFRSRCPTSLRGRCSLATMTTCSSRPRTAGASRNARSPWTSHCGRGVRESPNRSTFGDVDVYVDHRPTRGDELLPQLVGRLRWAASGLYRVNRWGSPERGARLARRERRNKLGICD